jgi:hypothetical protein
MFGLAAGSAMLCLGGESKIDARTSYRRHPAGFLFFAPRDEVFADAAANIRAPSERKIANKTDIGRDDNVARYSAFMQ